MKQNLVNEMCVVGFFVAAFGLLFLTGGSVGCSGGNLTDVAELGLYRINGSTVCCLEGCPTLEATELEIVPVFVYSSAELEALGFSICPCCQARFDRWVGR